MNLMRRCIVDVKNGQAEAVCVLTSNCCPDALNVWYDIFRWNLFFGVCRTVSVCEKFVVDDRAFYVHSWQYNITARDSIAKNAGSFTYLNIGHMRS